MDAHSYRKIRWANTYHMDKIKLNICGFSRAAYRTAFFIPELGILLDAGVQLHQRVTDIFITHCHVDHVAELPLTLIDQDYPVMYGPKGSKKFVRNYIHDMFEMTKYSSLPRSADDFSTYNEVDKNDDLSVNLKNMDIRIKIIECDHSVPTVSYLFRMLKDKLKPEYLGLTGKEICILKKDGIEIIMKVETKLFGYICDTSIKTIAEYESEISQYPYIIVECTFLYEDDIENSHTTKHIHWTQLEPFVAKYPNTIWILIHFSLRYKDSEVEEFFKDKNYPNIHLWIHRETI